jgi:hypothetical protein
MITEVRLIPNGNGTFSLMVNDSCMGVMTPNAGGTIAYDIIGTDYVPVDFSAPSDTKSAVSTMLKWNTGAHLLDSGLGGNRWWQMRANVDLASEPEAYLDEYGYQRNLYHYLTNCLQFDSQMQRIFDAFDEKLPDMDYFKVLEQFTKHYEFDVTSHGNTYNEETVLRGGFQYYELESSTGDTYVVVMSHNGADVRGGYSKPFFFKNSIEDLLVDMNSGDVWCASCDKFWYWDGYRWDSDDTKYKFLDNWNDSQYTCECGGKIVCC